MDEVLSIDEFPRHQPSNSYNFDELTLAKRQLEINAAKRDFPHIPENVISMSWDTVHNLGESAMNEIIETKAWEKAKKKDRPQVQERFKSKSAAYGHVDDQLERMLRRRLFVSVRYHLLPMRSLLNRRPH